MSQITQEQKDIQEIKGDIQSIRQHLANIKLDKSIEEGYRLELNRKMDLIVNSLVDNDFNGKNGIISKVRNIEIMVLSHDLYWKVLITVILAGGVLAGAIKYLVKI